MVDKRRKLSREEAHRLALHYAINERDSYVEAYGGQGPEAERARLLATEFRRVLLEEFGEITSEDSMAREPFSVITLAELMGRAKPA